MSRLGGTRRVSVVGGGVAGLADRLCYASGPRFIQAMAPLIEAEEPSWSFSR